MFVNSVYDRVRRGTRPRAPRVVERLFLYDRPERVAGYPAHYIDMNPLTAAVKMLRNVEHRRYKLCNKLGGVGTGGRSSAQARPGRAAARRRRARSADADASRGDTHRLLRLRTLTECLAAEFCTRVLRQFVFHLAR
ncbi:hypothetical protein EVAR_28160_1 [Eumeta japonica]|uniref:Uncharacterized protein n=1 Tax=Eumeta variegata TaxID=151549 RepID=A0A4C1VDZ1_EUMVA|nr:hypothetical protein EVAR_28160_1 [Eumeta japonica]